MMHSTINKDHQLYYFGDQINHNYMCGVCTMHGSDKISMMVQSMSWNTRRKETTCNTLM
jgi:hypothetical protein